MEILEMRLKYEQILLNKKESMESTAWEEHIHIVAQRWR